MLSALCAAVVFGSPSSHAKLNSAVCYRVRYEYAYDDGRTTRLNLRVEADLIDHTIGESHGWVSHRFTVRNLSSRGLPAGENSDLIAPVADFQGATYRIHRDGRVDFAVHGSVKRENLFALGLDAKPSRMQMVGDAWTTALKVEPHHTLEAPHTVRTRLLADELRGEFGGVTRFDPTSGRITSQSWKTSLTFDFDTSPTRLQIGWTLNECGLE